MPYICKVCGNHTHFEFELRGPVFIETSSGNQQEIDSLDASKARIDEITCSECGAKHSEEKVLRREE